MRKFCVALPAAVLALLLNGAALAESVNEKSCHQRSHADEAVSAYCGGLHALDAPGKGNDEDALADFNKALVLKPGWGLALASRGIAFYNIGDTAHAMADYNAALAVMPDDARTFANRAVAHAKLGDIDLAEKDFARATTLDATDAYIWHQRGAFHARRGKHGDAIVDYAKVIALTPADGSAANTETRLLGYYYKAYSEFFTGRYAEVVADCTVVLAMPGGDQPGPRFLRGVAKLRSGDKSGAADIDAAKTRQPNIADGFTESGIAP